MSEPIKIDGIGVEDLQNFDVEGYSDEDALVLSEGLLREALPCLDTIYPTFTAAQKTTIKFAVLEMARHLQIEAHNLDHTSSAMQSESLGSYSYSKAQRSVREGEATSVPAFDRAVGQFAHLCTIENGDGPDRKSTRLNSSHGEQSRMPSSA